MAGHVQSRSQDSRPLVRDPGSGDRIRVPPVVIEACIDDASPKGPSTRSEDHLRGGRRRDQGFPKNPVKAISTVSLSFGAADSFLQRSSDGVMVDDVVGLGPPYVIRDTDAQVADTEGDFPYAVRLSAGHRDKASGWTRTMLDRVLAKLAECHQDSVLNNCDIGEVIDQGLDQQVGEQVHLGELLQ